MDLIEGSNHKFESKTVQLKTKGKNSRVFSFCEYTTSNNDKELHTLIRCPIYDNFTTIVNVC